MCLGRSADSGQITSEMVCGSARMVLCYKDVGIENFTHSYEEPCEGKGVMERKE